MEPCQRQNCAKVSLQKHIPTPNKCPRVPWSTCSLKVWDFLCDKVRSANEVEDNEMEEDGVPECTEPEYQARKLQTYRLKVLLESLGEVVLQMGKMVQKCCVDADDPDPPSAAAKPPPAKKRKRAGPTAEDEEELVLSGESDSPIFYVDLTLNFYYFFCSQQNHEQGANEQDSQHIRQRLQAETRIARGVFSCLSRRRR